MKKTNQTKAESIFKRIRELADIPSFYKHDQLVQGIINSIDEKIIEKNDRLPSVNTMIKELHFSRATIVKGVAELVDRGIIGAQKRLGYFVIGAESQKIRKVALLMYNLDTFEEQFYRNFRHELNKDIRLDVYFHHGNIQTFESILIQVKGKYEMFVVAPIPDPKTKELLNMVPRNKFLMFDRFELLEGEFNHLTQEFEKSSFEAFKNLAPVIRKFEKIIFYHSPDSLDPKEMIQSFKRFLKDFKINGKIINEYIPGSVEKGTVYFTLDNFVLWEIMKEIKAKGFIPGSDVGVLSHNDEPAKEIIGITTFSTDFALMGKRAGQAVMNREKVHETIPTKLVRRNTL